MALCLAPEVLPAFPESQASCIVGGACISVGPSGSQNIEAIIDPCVINWVFSPFLHLQRVSRILDELVAIKHHKQLD